VGSLSLSLSSARARSRSDSAVAATRWTLRNIFETDAEEHQLNECPRSNLTPKHSTAAVFTWCALLMEPRSDKRPARSVPRWT